MQNPGLKNRGTTFKWRDDSQIDWPIIFIVLSLMAIGFVALYLAVQADSSASPLRALISQSFWWIFGWGIAIVLMHLDAQQLFRLAPITYAFGIFLLIFVLFAYNRALFDSNGGKSWLAFGGFTFQPSEVMKPALILMLSRVVYSHNQKYAEHVLTSDFILIGKMLLVTFPVIVLMLLQHDFGSMLVFVAIFAGIFLVSGILSRILVPIGATFAAIAGLAIFAVTTTIGRNFLANIGFQAYQFARVDDWLDPGSNDTTKSGYQLYQSIKAIGSGRIFGRGLSNISVYVPVRESDMIFSVIGEGLGFVGGFVLIMLYFLLIYSMIRRVFDTKSSFYAYVVSGVVLMLLFHVFENIGMSIDLVPLTGIPLPFISQGGSSLLANMIGIGLALSMQYHNFTSEFAKKETNFK
ncbi:rod shape-determining protein RodA [Oenococcus sicerae]|uniref:Rod shape-determining protein RodA n=1 Tax=Oenococcus sicerae TaxID=2203724 RepID=A0ABX5QNC6_9LACO|nr:FtsW/RodA/SpoVE family cell cycle protein [Oenococcus sicerae]QAS70107.1 rod shape-determining protein RodA [Oenococcus sicerae]VDK13674.1 Peptidoglycan glycosyltransferase RodA {ECO:0000255/HAMAP-Rule:MF_02079, ECO:0000303/PubMed:27525505} [Oenococcus sicerae]